MNHLAHALLAGDDEALVLGGMLGDFVRGAVPDTLPLRVQHGVRLHRAIDRHTDDHPIVHGLRSGFEPPFRRYAGILIDVWFDHLLARDFARWSETALPDFTTRLDGLLRTHADALPPDLQRFAAYMRRNDLPTRYGDRGMIARVYAGIGSRLQRANPLAEAMPAMIEREAELQRGFDAFFPELRAFARGFRESAE